MLLDPYGTVSKIEKNMGISKNAMGRQELYELAMTTPQGAEKALGAAWDNLKIAAGNSLIPIIIPALNKLAEVLRLVGQWVYRHPRMFDALIYGFAGLSGALLFSGTVLTLKAAFLGINLLMPTLATTITASVIPALGLLAAALVPLAAIAYHQDIANKIDSAAPGIGDSLLKARNFFTAPIPRQNTTINTAINLDGKTLATAVTQHQVAAANAPATSGSDFDGRMGVIQPSWGW